MLPPVSARKTVARHGTSANKSSERTRRTLINVEQDEGGLEIRREQIKPLLIMRVPETILALSRNFFDPNLSTKSLLGMPSKFASCLLSGGDFSPVDHDLQSEFGARVYPKPIAILGGVGFDNDLVSSLKRMFVPAPARHGRCRGHFESPVLKVADIIHNVHVN